MFDENLHHPKWSFVRGWNERECRCTKCTPLLWAQQQPQHLIPFVQPVQPVSPYEWYSQQRIGITPDQPVTITSGTTNVYK
jgi:hypothetical protein